MENACTPLQGLPVQDIKHTFSRTHTPDMRYRPHIQKSATAKQGFLHTHEPHSVQQKAREVLV